MKNLKMSICMPVYNGSQVIKETLESILSQSFKDYELIIVDDNSTDDTEKIIKQLKDPRIEYFRNEKNVGYSKNLEICRTKCSNDIIFLMAQDDILAKDALLKTVKVFEDDDVGAVTRPYYWFDTDIKKPVRAKKQLNENHDDIVSITSEPEKLSEVFSSVDQLSGLAYRRKFMDQKFHEDIFPCHVYPFASILKKHNIVYLRDYTIAVRIRSSQTRSVSSIYNKSPVQSWAEMFNTIYHEKEFENVRKYLIRNYLGKNHVQLIQIKNYSRFIHLIREMGMLIKCRWQNLLDIRFWFFCLGIIIVPRSILIPIVDIYKNKIHSKGLAYIKFEY